MQALRNEVTLLGRSWMHGYLSGIVTAGMIVFVHTCGFVELHCNKEWKLIFLVDKRGIFRRCVLTLSGYA